MSTSEKILLDEKELLKVIQELRKEGKTIVTTNGVFDLVHSDHVLCLEESAKFGDRLIVLINTDKSVKKNKGPYRPIISENDRAKVIAAFQSVGYVILFDEKTPERILQLIKPDIHVKGGDYKVGDLPETAIVEAGGGRVEIIDHIISVTSTDIIDRIVHRCM